MEFRPFWDVIADLGIDLPDAARIREHEAGLNPTETRRSQTKDCWVPPEDTIEVAGYKIPGMVYCGESLMSVNRRQVFEPSLIHPGLRTKCKTPDYAGKTLPLFLSYAQMAPAHRTAYLEWLASGRRMPEIGSSYVILFFHGLERRVFHDLLRIDVEKYPNKPDELKQIAEEAKQLKQLYPNSFGMNIDRLIEACELQFSEFETIAIEPSTSSAIRFQIGLGQFIQKNQPISPDWALAYCNQVAKTFNTTAAKRFPNEFRELFRVRYSQQFGDGIVIESNQSKLKVTYQPSSPSFANQSVNIQIKNLPNISSLSDQFSQLETVLEDCRKELDPLVRLLGRNSELQNTPTAIAPLPPELWHFSPSLMHFKQTLEQEFQKTKIVLLPGEALLKAWQSSHPDQLTPTETKSFLAFLEQCGYGVVPDLKSITTKSFIALYQALAGAITQNYESASLAVYLSVAILVSENTFTTINKTQLQTTIDSFFALSPVEQIRLEAYLTWLLTQSPSLRNLKSRIEKIDLEQRSTIAQFLIHINAKGSINPKTVQLLEKAYSLLGLDTKSIYRDIHDRATSELRDYPIAQNQRSLDLDLALIQSKIAESQEISGLLAEIFVDEPEPQKLALVSGLDAAHSELLRAIAAKELWHREELASIANQLNLMLDGALEVINEVAFDLCDESVIEGDNTLEVNGAVLQELLG